MSARQSDASKGIDDVAASLRPFMKDAGFRARARTFNRTTRDGLVHVVGLQAGRFDPPGTPHVPGLREDLHGKFTVNLGVYVPEVAKFRLAVAKAPPFVQESHCCWRVRLSELCAESSDLWWQPLPLENTVENLKRRLRERGIPWLDGFSDRDAFLAALSNSTSHFEAAPRIVRAIILGVRGEHERASELLSAQAASGDARHASYVRELANRLGLDAEF